VARGRRRLLVPFRLRGRRRFRPRWRWGGRRCPVQDLQAAAIGHDHREVRRGLSRRRAKLLDQGQRLEGGGPRVALGDPFRADSFGDAFDLFGVYRPIGEVVQQGTGLGEGATGRAGVGDLLE
jgi:hypothetical protein